MRLDKDLQSIQEARELAQTAKEAQLEFKHFNQKQVDQVVKAMAEAGYESSERLAKLAVEESGFGKWQDKVIKNQFSTKNVFDSIKDLRTVGVISIEANGRVVKIADPMGVVAALIPSTNPTSTAMFKALISLKCRNAIVASPHPRTANCTAEALKLLSDAAEQADAPKGLIQCMSLPTIEGTDALMHDKNIAVILATGSTPMVKAAYSAGKPAYGVGSGNVPAFIEKTADYKKAVADIIYGTTFDNGTLCSSEQSIIVDINLKEKVVEEAKTKGCYFVSPEEKRKLAAAIQKDFRINPAIVGQPAVFIAKYAGFEVPKNTKVLVAECLEVGKNDPLSMEKLSPILSFYTVDGWLEGCHKCIDLLEFGGIGHTMVIHSNDPDIIMKFAIEKPAFRILVNTVSSVGAVGYTTALSPSMTLGPGTIGGSIISDNVSAKHLMNIKSLAFETNPVNKGSSISTLNSAAGSYSTPNKPESSFMKEIEERLKARAGNPSYERSKFSGMNFGESPKSFSTANSEKSFPNFSSAPAKRDGGSNFSSSQGNDVKSSVVLGNGISEDEVKKIINEFKNG